MAITDDTAETSQPYCAGWEPRAVDHTGRIGVSIKGFAAAAVESTSSWSWLVLATAKQITCMTLLDIDYESFR